MNNTKQVGNVEVLTTRNGCICWSSDWCAMWDLVKTGEVVAVDGGPGTFGHTDFHIASEFTPDN